MKSLVKISLVLVTAVVLAACTASAQTDSSSTPAPATTNKPAATPKPKSKPYSGTIASADSDAKTITVTLASGDTQVIHITSKTRIKKDGQPGTLADATAGEKIKGYARKDDSGNWTAGSVNIGETKAKTATPPASAPSTTAPADTTK